MHAWRDPAQDDSNQDCEREQVDGQHDQFDDRGQRNGTDRRHAHEAKGDIEQQNQKHRCVLYCEGDQYRRRVQAAK